MRAEWEDWLPDGTAYRAVVPAADPLRMCYVRAPGHSTFTAAEIGAALTALTERIEDGKWPNTSPDIMNLRGRYLDSSAARFTDHDPGPGYRPFYTYSEYPGQFRASLVPVVNTKAPSQSS